MGVADMTTEKKSKTAPAKKESPFAQARKIYWANPSQDRATFLAACAAIQMNTATAKTRFYCLTTGRDASCKDEALRAA
ncbi:hypothetical protein DY251_09375 [Mesorhizobium denitrificans]|uniref:Uncharacterized protein n=1 Tax=Mesorhizobium denitrificans TaxID=2294114 RepID=A0A371XF24_9HYPH|nr:hypothetical protein DY251_09375 [Mesorhizobium denitrificans]